MINKASGFKNTSEYLYIIKSRNLYKIGKTNSLEQRLEAIRSTNPHEVELVHSARFDKAIPIEKALHKFFKTKRVSREWFALSKEDISRIGQTIVSIRKNNTRLHIELQAGILNKKKIQKRVSRRSDSLVQNARRSVVIIHKTQSNGGFNGFFNDLGLTTLTFKSFEKAKPAIKRYRPFLVIIISNLSGSILEYKEKICNIKKSFSQIKILFMSGIRTATDIKTKKMAGADYFLKIPFQLDDLHKIMTELFRERRKTNNINIVPETKGSPLGHCRR